MKKYLISLLLISPMAFKMPEMPEIKTPEVKIEKSLFVYQDENCTQEAANLSANQPFCVKVIIKSETVADATLTLLNSEKSELVQLTMAKIEDYYVAKTHAPEKEGIYYIHIEIRGEGLSYSAERGISVGVGENADSSIETSDVQAEVVLGENLESAQPEEKSEVADTAQPVYSPQKLEKLIYQLFRFLGKLLLF